MKKTYVIAGLLFSFFMNGSHQSKIPEIDYNSITSLQRQIRPHLQQKKCEDRQQDTVLNAAEEGVSRLVSVTLPQLDTLNEHLDNYKHRVAEYNSYANSYNQSIHLTEPESEIYRKTLLDKTIVGSLKLSDDVKEQLRKHVRVLVASRNVDPVWQVKKSIADWGLLYGPFIGTFCFFRNVCMPRNIYGYTAATAGFLGAFWLLKSTPKSDVNDSVVKTSALCIGGSATAVGIMQLYDSFGAEQSRDQLTTLNGQLQSTNLSLGNRFGILDNLVLGLKTNKKIDGVGQVVDEVKIGQVALRSTVEVGFEQTGIQHRQTQESLQMSATATRVVSQGVSGLTSTVKKGFEEVAQSQQDTNLGVGQVREELASNKRQQNARFDDMEKQVGQVSAMVKKINQELDKQGQRFKVTAEQLNGYFTSDAKDREACMKCLDDKFSKLESAIVYQIMQGAETLNLVKGMAQVRSPAITNGSAGDSHLQCQILTQGNAALPNGLKGRYNRPLANQSIKSWNNSVLQSRKNPDLFPLFMSQPATQLKPVEIPVEVSYPAAVSIQAAMRSKLVRVRAKNKLVK